MEDDRSGAADCYYYPSEACFCSPFAPPFLPSFVNSPPDLVPDETETEQDFLADFCLLQDLAAAAAASGTADFCFYLDAAVSHLTGLYSREEDRIPGLEEEFEVAGGFDAAVGTEVSDPRAEVEPEPVQEEAENHGGDDPPAAALDDAGIDPRAGEEQAEQLPPPKIEAETVQAAAAAAAQEAAIADEVEVVKVVDLEEQAEVEAESGRDESEMSKLGHGDDPAAGGSVENEVLRMLEFQVGFKRALEKNLVIDVDNLREIKSENESENESENDGGDGFARSRKRIRKIRAVDAPLVDALRSKNAGPKLSVSANGVRVLDADVYATHPADLLLKTPNGTGLFFATTSYTYRATRMRRLDESRWKQQGRSVPIKINDEIVAYKTYLSFVPRKNAAFPSPPLCAANVASFLPRRAAAKIRRLSRYTMEEIVLREDRENEQRTIQMGKIPRPFRVLCRISTRWPALDRSSLSLAKNPKF